MNLVSIIDYGSGNIRSVYNALNFLCAPQKKKVIVTKKFSEINKSSHIILPGVGSFESCINGLKESSLIPILEEKIIEKKTPFLGICVGMQMLATTGFENGKFRGLNWIKGEVKKLKTSTNYLKIPHMGWNKLEFKNKSLFISELEKKVNLDQVTAYFVHSYNFFLDVEYEKKITTDYGQEITAMVEKKNIIGTQFHPEKSHKFGLAFLETFLKYGEFL